MNINKINFSQKYIQDEHQRVLQNVVDVIASMQQQITVLQTAVKALKLKVGIK